MLGATVIRKTCVGRGGAFGMLVMFYIWTWVEVTRVYSFCDNCIYNWVNWVLYATDNCIHPCNCQPIQEKNISTASESFLVLLSSQSTNLPTPPPPTVATSITIFIHHSLFYCSGPSHQWSHSMYSCISGFFVQKFCYSFTVLQVPRVVSLLFLSSITLYEYTTIHFIHSSINAHLDYSQFRLSRIKLLWTSLHRSFCRHVLISLGQMPRSEIVGHLTFKETTKQFFKVDISIYSHNINIWGFQWLPIITSI